MTILNDNRHDVGYPKSESKELKVQKALALADKMAIIATAKAVLATYSDKEIAADEKLTALALGLDEFEKKLLNS